MKKYMLSVLILYSCLHAISLDKAIELTVANEPSLLSMEYQSKAKAKDIDIAKSKLYPNISATAGRTNRKYTTNFGDEQREERFNSYGINFNMFIYNKEIYENIAQAKLEHNIQVYRFKSYQNQIISEVVQIFTQALQTKSQIALENAALEYENARLAQAKGMLEKNMISLREYQTVQLQSYERAISLQKIKNQMQVLLQMLSHYTGVEVDSISDKVIIDTNVPTIEGVLESSAQLKLAKARVEVSKQGVKTAQSGHYPTLSLQGYYTEFDNDTIYSDYSKDQRISLELKIPLFGGWYVTSNSEKMRANLISSTYNYEKEKNETINQYKDLLLQLEIAKKSYKDYQKSVALAKEIYESTKVVYKNGQLTQLQLQDAKQTFYRAQNNLNIAHYNIIKTTMQLQLMQLENNSFIDNGNL